MSRAQAESVIKNIIREIAQECANKGQAVSETLVAFMVRSISLDSCKIELKHRADVFFVGPISLVSTFYIFRFVSFG